MLGMEEFISLSFKFKSNLLVKRVPPFCVVKERTNIQEVSGS